MCEPWPGPYCNEKTKDRDVRLAQFKEIVKSHEPESITYIEALYKLIASQEIYDLTPKGMIELQAEFNKVHKTFNPALLSRVIRARLTREFQVEALQEIENRRISLIAQIIELYDKAYSAAEIETVIMATREAVQEAAVQKSIAHANNVDVSMNEEKVQKIVENYFVAEAGEYEKYLSSIKYALNKKYDNRIPQKIIEVVNNLEEMEPPSKISMKIYGSLGNALEYSKKQLKEELGRIAAIQDCSLNVAAEYFDSYRNQYIDNYNALPLPKKPVPPKLWIEGELYDNGITKNSSSSFVPRDSATLYALSRLRTDLTAIPDYLKLSTKYISIEMKESGFIAKHITRTGKQLGKEVGLVSQSLPSFFEKYNKDSVLIIIGEPKGEIKEQVALGRVISIQDIVAKHFDLPKKNEDFIAEYFKTSHEPYEIYSVLRKKMMKTWASKPSRVNVPRLAHSPVGDSKYLTIVR
jgi:hypothetical protein